MHSAKHRLTVLVTAWLALLSANLFAQDNQAEAPKAETAKDATANEKAAQG